MSTTQGVPLAVLLLALLLTAAPPVVAQSVPEPPAVAAAQAEADRLQPIWQQADDAERTRIGVELVEALRQANRSADVLELFGQLGPETTTPEQEERLLNAALAATLALRSSDGQAAVLARLEQLDPATLPVASLLSLWDRFVSTQVGVGQFVQAEASARRGLALAAAEPSKEEFLLRRALAVTQAQQGKIAEAIESMLAAEKVAIAANVALGSAFLMNFGGMLIYAEDLPRAIDYLQRAEKAALAPGGDDSRLASIYSNLGVAHNGLRQLDEAQRNYERSIEVARSRGDSPATGLNNLAYVLMERGQVGEAKSRFEEVLAMNQASGDRVSEAISMKNLGEALIKLGQRERAADVLEQAHALQVEMDNRPKRLELLPLMVDNYEALGQHTEALATLRELKTLNDEAINADAQARIAGLQGDIDLAERDRELAASEVERAQQEASIIALRAAEQRQRWLAYGLAFGVLGLTIVLSVLVRQNRFRARAHRALEEKNREIESQQSNLKALNQQVIEQSLRDELTQLPNRRFLNEYMQKRQAAGLEAASPMLLLIIDIDHFKQLNDSYGHLVGDQALVHLAGVLRGVQRESDVMVRWGGEEFIWLCPGRAVEAAGGLFERVRVALRDSPFVVEDKTLTLEVSIGVAPVPLWPERSGDWSVSLRAADAALYRAKRQGRNAWAGLAGIEGTAGPSSNDEPVEALLASGQLISLPAD